MNEFTKQELEFIWQKLATANYDNTEMHDLPNKVCSMIDSYCDHLWVRGKCFECGKEKD